MFFFAMGAGGDSPPQCTNNEALGVIRKFAGLAMGTNYAYESDEVAEAMIQNYYYGAREQLQEILKCSKDAEQKACFDRLDRSACDAVKVNDSGLEIAFSTCDALSYGGEVRPITKRDVNEESPWYAYVLLGPPIIAIASVVVIGGIIASPFKSETGATFIDSLFGNKA